MRALPNYDTNPLFNQGGGYKERFVAARGFEPSRGGFGELLFRAVAETSLALRASISRSHWPLSAVVFSFGLDEGSLDRSLTVAAQQAQRQVFAELSYSAIPIVRLLLYGGVRARLNSTEGL
jgi:hypothetical protein